MNNKNAFSQMTSAGERQDDISALSEAFSIKAFRYIDIARQERLARIVAHWPLLTELATERKD
jgi:hypothetical protein